MQLRANIKLRANLSRPAGYDGEFELLLERLKKCLAQQRLLVELQTWRDRSSVITAARVSTTQKGPGVKRTALRTRELRPREKEFLHQPSIRSP